MKRPASSTRKTDKQRTSRATSSRVSTKRAKKTTLRATDDNKQQYSGRIVIRIRRDVDLAGEGETLLEYAKKQGLSELVRVLTEFDLQKSQRVILSSPAKEILALEAEALKVAPPELRPKRSLASYWHIDTQGRSEDSIEGIVTALGALKETIDTVYRESNVSLPAPVINPSDDSRFPSQGYLGPAPDGINAIWAWGIGGTNGEGVGLVDIEKDWREDHEDLKGNNPILVPTSVRTGITFEMDHGTGVLGIIASVDNSLGIVGIGTNLQFVRMASVYLSTSPQQPNVPDAIYNNIRQGINPRLLPGEVMLLELQTEYTKLPVEIEYAVFDAILLASGLGVIVIEAAGNNGRLNLDDITNYVGIHGGADAQVFPHIFKRSPASADYINRGDSGAVLVGACMHKVVHGNLHARWTDNQTSDSSNYGSRVDCYAWGESITTCGGLRSTASSTADPLTTYTNDFSGTSGAAAIIAGAAILLQKIHQNANHGNRLLPLPLRALLSNQSTGTKQELDLVMLDPIGVMPDLLAIASVM